MNTDVINSSNRCVDYVKAYDEMIAMKNFCITASQLMGKKAEEFFLISVAAKSMNMDPFYAINKGLCLIQGKVAMSAESMCCLIRKNGHSLLKDKNSNDSICILHGKRRDTGEEWTESFSIEDANNAGLLNKDIWKKYPEAMLYNRAVSKLFRRLFADLAVGTGYTPEEVEKEINNNYCSKSLNRVIEKVDVFFENKNINEDQYNHITSMLEILGDDYKRTVEEYLNKQEYDKTEDLYIKMPVKLYDNIIKRIESKFNEIQDYKIYEEEGNEAA